MLLEATAKLLWLVSNIVVCLRIKVLYVIILSVLKSELVLLQDYFLALMFKLMRLLSFNNLFAFPIFTYRIFTNNNL